jgi:hypothetical protein
MTALLVQAKISFKAQSGKDKYACTVADIHWFELLRLNTQPCVCTVAINNAA